MKRVEELNKQVQNSETEVQELNEDVKKSQEGKNELLEQKEKLQLNKEIEVFKKYLIKDFSYKNYLATNKNDIAYRDLFLFNRVL